MNAKQRKTIMVGGWAVCVGLLVGCTSSKYEDESSYAIVTEPSGASMEQKTAAPSDQTEWVIPLHEEQVKVGTRSVDTGQVTLRKTVTTETVSQPVDLRKERLIIEREPAGAEAKSSRVGTPFEAQSVTIGLREEQPVIEKTTVQTGQVVAKKNAYWNKQTVQQEVRHEDIQLDKSAGNSNVEVKGSFKESP